MSNHVALLYQMGVGVSVIASAVAVVFVMFTIRHRVKSYSEHSEPIRYFMAGMGLVILYGIATIVIIAALAIVSLGVGRVVTG